MRVFLILMFICCHSFAEFGKLQSKKEKRTAEKAFSHFEKEVQSLEDLAFYTNESLGSIIKRASRDLNLKGSWNLARELERGWASLDGELIQMVNQQKTRVVFQDIGDFEPLNQWLSEAYEKIEADLGYEYCLSQRISDLKTINHGLIVVFQLCDYTYPEFFKHFASEDPKYRSFLPVISYWTTLTSCYAGTYGTGSVMICPSAADLVESMVDEKLAPSLAPKLYEGACNQDPSF